jgi:Fe-coproporphyrin III synthase
MCQWCIKNMSLWQLNSSAATNFVVNGVKQLLLMKGNWGGIGTTPVQCPSWAILSLDHMGRVKQPCCIGSADSNSLKPICEQCGLGCYSVLVAQGITGKIW